MSSRAFRAPAALTFAATFSLFALVACGQVQSLAPDATASDASRPPPVARADSTPDVTVHDAGYAPSPPAYDAGHDAAPDSTPHDAAADTTLPDSSPDAAVPHDAAADVAHDAPGIDVFDPPVDAGHDATFPPDGYFAGPPDAEWLVDAAVDASSCATIAASICARIAACPDRQMQLCMRVEPETLCVGDYAGCVALFSACVPTASPPPTHLTFMPDPAACAVALAPNDCVEAGGDYTYEVPTSCAVCPGPWVGTPVCPFNLPDAGPDAL